ncbi:thiamine pyrophosphate-binding protein [Candidatus Entotheonella palauensis]|uniref:thiamine pyrophosphate-binding protein n=1 Tax=Candidatus Entotheonella palauensis TaxID=93172 RepID=UPI002118FFAF|nr:thiamine pyrophosphate-binding protein [Candidatus Entotheonella palauensis]
MTTVATALIELLAEAGVQYVFGVPSGPWVPYMEAMRTGPVEFVLVSNEASAGFMADVCGRLTGRPGACYGTFGPGATNLSTGVGGALLDRSPLLAFTTEVPAAMAYRTLQMAIDHQALFRPLTKWTTQAAPSHLHQTIRRAVQVATAEVPGPVHVGLPADMGNQVVPSEVRTGAMPFGLPAAPPPVDQLAAVDALLRRAKRPLLVAGLSCTRLANGSAWQQMVARHQLPVVLSPMAKGLLSETHPAYVGVLFHALSDLVAETIQEADLVLAVGYDPVEFNVEEWLPDVPFVHVDTVPADVDVSVQLAAEVVGDLGTALQFLADQPPYEHTWDLEVIAVRRHRLFETLMASSASLSPACVIGAIQDVLPPDEGYLTCDVGAHTHLIGQLWRTSRPGQLLMTNGWSSMGFGIPAAIAAKLCRPQHPVVCVTGDGGFLMMAGEMATAARLGLPVVVVVLVDRYIQLITVKQERQGAPQYGTQLYPPGYTSPDHYFGVPVVAAHDVDEVREAVAQGLRGSAPLVVEALVDPAAYDEVILRPHKLG